MNRYGRVSLFVAAVAVFAGGCTVESKVEFTPPEVPEAAVEKNATDRLSQTVGRRLEKIDCPSGLRAKVGATMRCVLSDGGRRYGVTVRATSVKGTRVNFDALIDEKPMT